MDSPTGTTNPQIDVSIVIPIYKGSGLLDKHITPFLSYLKTRPFKTQVILVDDGSPDRKLVEEYAKSNSLVFHALPTNTGKGAALRKGFELANGAVQLFTDADIPFQYENIDSFVSLLKQNPDQFLIGNRTDPASVYFEKTGFLRNTGSNVLSNLVNKFFVKGIRDSQCGLKAMGKNIARKLFAQSRINRFAIDIELIYLANKLKIPIVKVPVHLRYNDKSSVNIVNDGFKLLWDLYRIKKIHGS